MPPQEVITKDNVPVRVNAVAYFRIVEPKNAIVQVENFMVATSQIAQTTLRSVLGQHMLDELLSERDKINQILQGIIDEATSPWGIKVSIVEVKDVEIPSGMQRAMARQAEAERERRAKVIAAEGEFQASERLKDAAHIMAQEPITVQLRYLQTLLEIGSANNSTIVFPIPVDLLQPFLEQAGIEGRLVLVGFVHVLAGSSTSIQRRELTRSVTGGLRVNRGRLGNAVLRRLVLAGRDERQARNLLALARPHRRSRPASSDPSA